MTITLKYEAHRAGRKKPSTIIGDATGWRDAVKQAKALIYRGRTKAVLVSDDGSYWEIIDAASLATNYPVRKIA